MQAVLDTTEVELHHGCLAVLVLTEGCLSVEVPTTVVGAACRINVAVSIVNSGLKKQGQLASLTAWIVLPSRQL